MTEAEGTVVIESGKKIIPLWNTKVIINRNKWTFGGHHIIYFYHLTESEIDRM